MAGISLITNFNINAFAPIDSRLIATSSSVRDNIQYKYEGLKVYDTSEQKTFTWTGTTWSVEGNGIYGGSGSLISNTVVNTGTIGNTIGDKSYQFGFSATTSTTYYKYNNYFKRVGTSDFEWNGEFSSNGTILGYQYFGKDYIKFGLSTQDILKINNDSSISIHNSLYNGKISALALTSNQIYKLPPTGGTFAMISDVLAGAQTLQNVTSLGSTTSYGIMLIGSSMSIISNVYYNGVIGNNRTVAYFGPTAIGVSYNDYHSATAWGTSIESFENSIDGNRIVFKQGTYSSYIYSSNTTGPRNIRFPNGSGIVRLISHDVNWSLTQLDTITNSSTVSVGNSFVCLNSSSGTKTIKLPEVTISNGNLGSVLLLNVISGTWETTTDTSRSLWIGNNQTSASTVTLPIGITRVIGSVVNYSPTTYGWVKW